MISAALSASCTSTSRTSTNPSENIISTPNNGTFTLSPNGNYEIEAFLCLPVGDDVGTNLGYLQYSGHTYKFLPAVMTWNEAKANCEAVGGHLATITSEGERQFLVSKCTNTSFLGGNATDRTTWQWVTGESTTYVTNYTNKDGKTGSSLFGNRGNYTFLQIATMSDGTFDIGSGLYSYWRPVLCEWDELFDATWQLGSENNNIFQFGDFSLTKTKAHNLCIHSTAWGIDKTSDTAMSTNEWVHILVRVSNGTVTVYANRKEILSAPIIGDETISPSQVTLGGYIGYMDEFVFKHSAGTGAPTVPTHPYSGKLNIVKVGGYKGYGTIDSGSLTVSSDSQLNSYGMINKIIDAKTFTVASWSNGLYPAEAGCEVMIHITAPRSTEGADYPLVGLYAFAKVEELDGNNVTLSKEITDTNGGDFDLDSSLLSTYYVQAIIVRVCNSLIIDSGITIKPLTWSTTTGGGIVAIRTIGDCTINGNILTHGTGAIRYDWCQMTNSKLIDRFLCSQGGGIFITCGGTLTTGVDVRLGASWSGEGDGSNGAAGYGGNGGSRCPSQTIKASGGSGGVGGGGGGATNYMSNSYANGGVVGLNGANATGGAGGGAGGGACGGVGGDGTTSSLGGGGGGGQGNSGSSGGKSGYSGTINGGSMKSASIASGYIAYSGGGGGAPGGNGGNGANQSYYSKETYTYNGGIAGASIIIISKKLNIDLQSISTGGAGGRGQESWYITSQSGGGAGGGGTGFCYIACKEQVES